MRASIAGVILCASGLAAGPASAQIWIGEIAGQMVASENQHQCMSGRVPPPSEVREALAPAGAALRYYWDGATGGVPATMLAAFHADDRKARWSYRGRETRPSALAAGGDPLAVRGATLAAEPVSFVRAGDAVSAAGVWQVRDAGGATAGWYRVLLKRRAGSWKIRELAAFDAADRPAAVTQFCQDPGDVEPYLRTIADREARRAARNARKAAERQARAAAR